MTTKLDSCIAKLDALSYRFDNFMKRRGDAMAKANTRGDAKPTGSANLDKAIELLDQYDDHEGRSMQLDEAHRAAVSGNIAKAIRLIDAHDAHGGNTRLLDEAREYLEKAGNERQDAEGGYRYSVMMSKLSGAPDSFSSATYEEIEHKVADWAQGKGVSDLEFDHMTDQIDVGHRGKKFMVLMSI